ncbi:MAG: aminotransferase class IV [Phycisphaerales bacterium]|nr:aminotransferase class IV [Phycisphaerales bacterium]
MEEWIWINGQTMPLASASVSIEDRGFQFADGVYEVIRLYHGQPFTLPQHLQRLQRSAAGIELDVPLPESELSAAIEKLVDQSGLDDGMIYLQLTRGYQRRNHVWNSDLPATLLFYTRALPALAAPGKAPGVKLHPVADERWLRCWVKSIALLPNVLAKNAAVRAGADEAVFIGQQEQLSECSASNLFAVVDGVLVTAPVGPRVLPGVTRLVLLELAQQLGIAVRQQVLTQDQALKADELFITSTTRELSWVSHWGNRQLFTKCGATTLRLHQAFRQRVRHELRPIPVRLTA